MKKTGKRHRPFHVECPFCGFLCTAPEQTPMTWCSGCFVEYYTTRNGSVVFDDKLKTDRFIWAKALQKSGGMRLSKLPDLPGESSETKQ